MRRIIFSLILLATCLSSYATFFEKGNSAYAAENYTEAIKNYEYSVKKEGATAETWYNLGNAWYRQGNLGRAILCYERALKLNPAMDEAAQNLQFVNDKIEDQPEDDTSFLYGIYQSVMTWFSPTGWAWAALILFVLTLGAVAVYIFAPMVIVRKIGFFGGLGIMVLTVGAVWMAYASASVADDNSHAIVLADSTILCSQPRTPKDNSENAVYLHSGTKVEIVDSTSTPGDPRVSKWYEVRVNSSTRAWLNAADVERI